MEGWIKLHRELADKPIWKNSTPEQKTILITLLMMANHREKEWEWKGKSFQAKPGQFVTSLPKIMKKSGKGISIQNVRTALTRFKKYEFLTDESTNVNRLITIVNWDLYQSKDEQPTDEPTGNQQTPNRQLTSNKNERMKELKKDIYGETVLLSGEEYSRLVNEWGEEELHYWIDQLDEWQINNPKKTKKDHNLTLRNWKRGDDRKKAEQKIKKDKVLSYQDHVIDLQRRMEGRSEYDTG